MSVKLGFLAVSAVAALAYAGSAGAAGLKQVGFIDVPGNKLDSYDISYVDQKTQRLYLADRSNKAVDVFDAKAEKYIGRVEGFVGTNPDGDLAGPNGVVAYGDQAWAGDGDSTLKFIDLKTMKVTDSVSTGGKKRADELDYDPKDQIIAIANDADDPPFLTLVSTKPGHKIIAKVVFDKASDGLEQSYYDAPSGKFYVSVPQLDNVPSKGAVAIIDPTTGKLEKMVDVENCHPQGFDKGPNNNVILGCGAGGKDTKLPPLTVIWNMKTEKVVATTNKVGGSDEAAYNRKLNLYITGSRQAPGGPSLGVIDAKTNQWIENVAAPPNPHSVAANNTNGHVYTPSAYSKGLGCACILVFGAK